MPYNFWFDTEFIETGSEIFLISIGIVREDGAEYYAEVKDDQIPWEKADDWVIKNVRSLLADDDDPCRKWLDRIAYDIVMFVNERPMGTTPRFHAWYGSYDWTVLCRLYGGLMNLPVGWPMYQTDLRVLVDEYPTPLPKQFGAKHNALEDARWNRMVFSEIQRAKARMFGR